ncbi:MAG: isoprenylcysteine carboxylmethyltransferase family protein [Candidatus Binatia bacterium]
MIEHNITIENTTETEIKFPVVSPFFGPSLVRLRRGGVQVGRVLFAVRNYLFPSLFVALLFTTRPHLLFNSERADWWMDGLGFIVACLGEGCRLLAVGSVSNIRRGGRHKRVAAEELICTGAFSLCRNPLYVGNLLIFTGLTFIANSYGWYLLALPLVFVFYWTIILAEEDFLAVKFGEHFTNYRQTVCRLLPPRKGLVLKTRQIRLDCRRALRKEYGVACSWISMAIGLLMWERWAAFGYTARRLQIEQLALSLGLLFFSYLATACFARLQRR